MCEMRMASKSVMAWRMGRQKFMTAQWLLRRVMIWKGNLTEKGTSRWPFELHEDIISTLKIGGGPGVKVGFQIRQMHPISVTLTFKGKQNMADR